MDREPRGHVGEVLTPAPETVRLPSACRLPLTAAPSQADACKGLKQCLPATKPDSILPESGRWQQGMATQPTDLEPSTISSPTPLGLAGLNFGATER